MIWRGWSLNDRMQWQVECLMDCSRQSMVHDWRGSIYAFKKWPEWVWMRGLWRPPHTSSKIWASCVANSVTAVPIGLRAFGSRNWLLLDDNFHTICKVIATGNCWCSWTTDCRGNLILFLAHQLHFFYVCFFMEKLMNKYWVFLWTTMLAADLIFFSLIAAQIGCEVGRFIWKMYRPAILCWDLFGELQNGCKMLYNFQL